MRQSKNRLNLLAQLAALPFIAIALMLLVNGMSGYSDTHDSLDKANVQAIVETYAIQCYASEGSYPPDLDYLVKHYGLILDKKRFIYEYEIFASNIMPTINVHDNLYLNNTP